MILSVLNHSFCYETENVLRIFFPLEKITVVPDLPPETENYALTVRKCEAGQCTLFCAVRLGDKKEKREKTIPDGDEKEQELVLAQLLYEVLTALTGYTPPWGILTGVRPSKLMRSLIASEGEEAASRYFRDKLFVSPEKTELARSVANAEDRIITLSTPESYSLYVSIPFCPTRCSYCSFVSHSIAQAKKLMPDYVRLLCEELKMIAGIANGLGLKLETIYFGGGTPTSLDERELATVTKAVADCFDVSAVREYTIEAGRPDTLNPEKLKIMKDAGVTRISVNPQTFRDEVLQTIGRRHTAQMIVDTFGEARKAGFDTINMDLIAGLPGDSFEGFCDSVEKAIALSPENITVHTLALKRASSLVTGGEAGTAARETCRMLSFAADALTQNGYFPYYMYRQSKSVGNNENVGWSREGQECLYNIYMMEEIHTVLAAGGGAVTKLKSPYENKIERIFNFKYPYEYISRFGEQAERKNRITAFYEELGK